MSYTAASATASCTIAGLHSTREAALAVYDYLVNHPDEIPDELNQYDSDDTVVEIENYLDLSGENLTISYSTEEASCDPEVFDFLSKHFACLQKSPFMEVTWTVHGSHSGYTSGTDYYDRAGQQINVRDILTAYLTRQND